MSVNPLMHSPILGYAHHKILLDEDGVPVDYEFLEINEAFVQLTGLQAERILGRTARSVLPGIENDAFNWISVFGEAALNGQPKHFEQYSSVLNRWYKVHVYSPEPMHFTTIFLDINETKQYQQVLAEKKFWLEKAQEIGQFGSWKLDLRTNELSWSDEVYHIFGLQPGMFEPSYPAFLEMVHPDDREAVHTAYTTSVEQGHDTYEIEHRIVRSSDGELRYLIEKCGHIRSESGKIIASLGVVMDNTRFRLAELNLEDARKRAEHASDVKSQFLANMSHEIRTPLNGIIGFGELLKTTQLSPTQKEYVSNVTLSGQNLLRIINDILDFSKIEAGMIQLEYIHTDLSELLHNIIAMFTHKAEEKKLALKLRICEKMPRYVLTDPLRLSQILTNLLSNAIKFTSEGSVELIAACEQDTDDHVLVTFTVTDTGIGISNSQKSRLFKAFTQADASISRKFGGTGLGLVISQSLAEKMGSHIHLESEFGKGTRFYLSVLMQVTAQGYIDEETTSLTRGHNVDTAEPGSEFRADAHILVADDTRMNLNLMMALLKNVLPGARLAGASNGQEAVEYYLKNSPDLIFMDVRMPEMDGLQATSEIRRLEAEAGTMRPIPIVAMSAAVYQEDQLRCTKAGMNDFIGKPVDIKKVRSLLGEYLSQKR
jgi:two-component system, chemotaxis family, CheB/CheR fusion protein